MVDISISIVTHNSISYLPGCLNSIFSSEIKDIVMEVFVADNKSDDGSVEFVRSEYPQVKLIVNKRRYGYSHNNNIALKEARGKYILVMNPDVKLEKFTLSKMLNFMEENPSCGLSTCKTIGFDGELQYNCRTFPTLKTISARRLPINSAHFKKIVDEHLMKNYDYNSVLKPDWVSGSFMFVRSEAIKDVGLMDEKFFLYFEDVDWCYRMWEKGWEVMYNPDAIIYHRVHRQSQNPFSKMALIHLKSMIYYFYKRSKGKRKNLFKNSDRRNS
ncbi:MAG: glycosyltransferase family 2 protein [bacterium]